MDNLSTFNYLRSSWIKVAEPEVAPVGFRPVYLLRKEFEISEVSNEAIIRLSAQGVYEAFLNGKRIGDAELTPGFTKYDSRIQVQEYSVADLLVQGANVLVIHLADGWFRGCQGFRQHGDHFGKHVAALAELTIDGYSPLKIVTDSTWKVATSHILSADFFRGQHDDRRLFNPSVYLSNFDDSNWGNVLDHSVEAELIAESAPPIKRTHVFAPLSITRVSSNGHVVDFGQNLDGWIRLKKLGPAGNKVTIQHGEALDSQGLVTIDNLDAFDDDWKVLKSEQTDSVISAGVTGDVFEPRFTSKGFQFVQVEGLETLATEDIEAIHVQSDLQLIGGFTCSDERLNSLHKAAEWSFRGNALEVPTDCPTRERSGFTGDWQIFAPTAAYLFDVETWSRRWMTDVLLDQSADGVVALTSPAESDVWTRQPDFNGSAGWGDVVSIVPMAMHWAYGNQIDMDLCFDGSVRWVEFAAKTAATKRHPKRTGEVRPHEKFLWDFGFHWGEWLEAGSKPPTWPDFYDEDKSEVATAYLAHSAHLTMQMAEKLGKSQDVIDHFAAISAGAKAAWCEEFISPDGTLRVQTQASHLRALEFQLVPEALRPKVAAGLVALIHEANDHLGTGFLSTPFLLPNLADAGYVDLAFRILMQDTSPSWLYMLKKGATTVWEDWEGIKEDGSITASLNHYSKGAVVSFLHNYVAGLKATEPGFSEFRVQPHIGAGLTSASTWHRSPRGLISVDWEIVGNLFKLKVGVPVGAKAEAIMPDGSVVKLKSGEMNHVTCLMSVLAEVPRIY
jgi:alpha-L-rhamnosidase